MATADLAVKEVALVSPDPYLDLYERLAKDPSVDVAKFEKILDLKRGVDAERAKAAFFADFAAMQIELPTISKRGEILNRNGQVQSTFAQYEDIQRAVKPILRKWRFSVSHSQAPDTTKEMVIVTHLVHAEGHVLSSTFKADADTSGSKNAVQGLGSVSQYGKRYNLVALLDLEISGKDNDAQSAGQKAVDAPAGFEDWWDNIVAVADEGTEKLFATWKASKEEYRDHVFATNKAGWNAIKGKAAKATKDAKAVSRG
jgi:hypothetical protein